MRSVIFVIFSVLACTANSAPNFTFSNPPGPYSVGLHIVKQVDQSRAFNDRVDLITGESPKGPTARPIQSLVWYPAQAGGASVTYLDYMRIAASEGTINMTDAQVDSTLNENLVDLTKTWGAAQMREETAHPMWAVQDAKAKPGKFPLVVYAPSFSHSAAENVDMCEFLASHGYVVIAIPSMGAHSRAMTADLEGIEAQALDIEYAIGYAQSLPEVDTAHIAVAGFSYGGISNVFAAAKDSRITALVSLDGAVRYETNLINGGKGAAKYVNPAQMTVPLLYVASQPSSIEELAKEKVDTSWSALDEMKYADVYKVTMQPMMHIDFGSHNLRFVADATPGDYSRQEVSLAHSWMVRYVGQFLDAYLKNDAAASAFINNPPAKNAVPLHMLTIDVHRAQAIPANRESFATELGKRGFEHASVIYQELHKKNPDFQLSTDDVTGWGYQLLQMQKTRKAIAIFALGASIYPENWNTYDSLAEAYEQNGDKILAIKNYQHSLQLNPQNDNAIQHLKDLGTVLSNK
jgi:dienelactone hydrolase